MNLLVERALETAIQELGVREVGANRGRRVEAYQRAAGLPVGVPWCACFVYWCIETAAHSVGMTHSFPRTGWCPDIEAWAKHHHILHTAPEPGDVFLAYSISEAGGHATSRAHHTGFVLKVRADNWETVEGNTNPDGGAEGYGVFRRRRKGSDFYRFVRWEELLESGDWVLLISGKEVSRMPIVAGRALCSVRDWCDALGLEMKWNTATQSMKLNGKVIPVEASILREELMMPVRELARFCGLTVTVDADSRRVEVTRPRR